MSAIKIFCLMLLLLSCIVHIGYSFMHNVGFQYNIPVIWKHSFSQQCVMCTPTFERKPSLLTFREPTTGVTVKLVGAMHYNPASIKLAKFTVEELASTDRLSYVVVESCPKRWEKMQLMQPEGSFLKSLLENEMQSASEVATKYGIPTVLGDQDIETTNKNIGNSLKLTFKELALPFNGGWKSLSSDLKKSFAASLPGGTAYLGPQDFFYQELLFGTPTSLIRYPLALIIKSPLVGMVLLSIFGFSFHEIGVSLTGTSGEVVVPSENLFDYAVEVVTSVAGSALEVIILGRVFLVALLAERNDIIAEKIVSACRQATDNGTLSGDDKHVVAVLGMAHCNGVKKLLMEQLVK